MFYVLIAGLVPIIAAYLITYALVDIKFKL